MQVTKQMIDLVQEIRRRAPTADKAGIKLANPELLHDLIPFYHSTNDNIVKALMKELFSIAGENWLEQLLKPETKIINEENAEPRKRYITKVYRGQTQLVEVKPESLKPAASQRIYRGQVVS